MWEFLHANCLKIRNFSCKYTFGLRLGLQHLMIIRQMCAPHGAINTPPAPIECTAPAKNTTRALRGARTISISLVWLREAVQRM